MGKIAVRGEHGDCVRRESGRSSESEAKLFRDGGKHFRRFQGNAEHRSFQSGKLPDGHENLPNGRVVSRKNIAFPPFSALGAEKNSVGDVADIDEVVAALHRKRQFSAQKGAYQLRYISAAFVAGTDDPGRLNNRGV